MPALSRRRKDRSRDAPNTTSLIAFERVPHEFMAYIITEPCIGTKDKSCVDVCPVDCIHGKEEDKQLFIDPEVCIDCGACVSACPVEAIYADSDLPEKWNEYTAINANYFKSN